MADTSQNLVNKSNRINRMIQNNSDDLTKNEISSIMRKLNQIKDIIAGTSTGGGYDRMACSDFAYEIYYKSNSNEVALDKAAKACSSFKELPVLEVLYEYANKSLRSVNAIDLALIHSGTNARDKGPEAKFLIEKYYISLDGPNSVKKTGLAISKLNPGSLNCLEQAFTRYFRTLGAMNSAEKAVNFCQR